MPRIFIVGAHLPRGGGYMAYHVGRIVGRRLGLDPVAVTVAAETATGGAFEYPDAFPAVALDELLDVADRADVLVCNPLWSERMAARHPGTGAIFTTVSDVRHGDLLDLMQRHRYLLSLNPLEGSG